MIFDKLFSQSRILESSLQASSLRNEVILNNIANAETPKFKKSAVQFESLLGDALDDARKTGEAIDLSKLKPAVNVVNKGYSARLDGNNVDIEAEMVLLYENSVRYDAMINSITSNSKRNSLVLNGR